jgi:hypothetical protein
MSSLRIGWEAQRDATRRLWRIYLSEVETIKGKMIAEADGADTAYRIRDVPEGKWFVRVIAVNNAGTETDWKLPVVTGSTASVVVSRDKEDPSTPTNAGANQVVNELSIQVTLDPPDENDPPQEVEVIQGPDASLGQLLTSAPAERGSETGDVGERTVTAPVPALPGRTGTRRVLSIRGRTKAAKHPGSAVTVPITTIDYPNHDSVVVGSVVTGTLTNIYAPISTDSWEAGTYGIRLRAHPPSTNWNGGWGTSGSGILANEPSGSYYVREAAITVATYDLGSAKDFWLECYDEAQRDANGLALTSVASKDLAYASGPVEVDRFSGGDRNVNWAFDLFRSDGKPRRPLPKTRWQYQTSLTTNLGDWQEYVPGARANGRYVRARMYLDEPTGFSRVEVPYAYVRAWTPHDQAPITPTPPHDGVLQPVGYAYLGLSEGTTAQDIGQSPVTVTYYEGTPTTYAISASTTTGVFTVRHGGVYDVDFSSSFSGSNPGMTIECYLWVNTTEQDAEFHRSIGTANAIGSAAFGAQVSLATNDIVFVKVESDTNSRSWTPEALTFKMKRMR